MVQGLEIASLLDFILRDLSNIRNFYHLYYFVQRVDVLHEAKMTNLFSLPIIGLNLFFLGGAGVMIECRTFFALVRSPIVP